MNNKKSIMAFSALEILIFHLWIDMFPGNPVEMFLRRSCFVGVDIFFFLSGYSLAERKIDDYLAFVCNRLKSVYLKFILFAVVAFFWSGWSFIRLLKVISYVELIQKGGGAFLWFLPTIMVFYFAFPLFQKCEHERPAFTLTVTIALWIAVGYIGWYRLGISNLFIIWNRVPVFLLGYYFSRYSLFKALGEKGPLNINFTSFIAGGLLTVIGLQLLYYASFTSRLQKPFPDMFYVVAIPVVVGLVILVSRIPEKKLITLVGSSTLEMYAIQMIFGYGLANKLYIFTENRLATNVLTIAIITAIAIAVSQIHYRVMSVKGLLNVKKDKKE